MANGYFLNWQRIFPHIMEAGSVLLCSQVSVYFLYSVPNNYYPKLLILLI